MIDSLDIGNFEPLQSRCESNKDFAAVPVVDCAHVPVQVSLGLQAHDAYPGRQSEGLSVEQVLSLPDGVQKQVLSFDNTSESFRIAAFVRMRAAAKCQIGSSDVLIRRMCIDVQNNKCVFRGWIEEDTLEITKLI